MIFGRQRSGALTRVSLRFRLFLLILFALSPILAARLIDISRSVDMHTRDTQRQLEDLARAVASDHDERIIKARTLLDTTVQIPAIRAMDRQECHEMLRRVGSNAPWQSGLWVVDTTGQVRCASLNPNLSLNIADRAYFREMMETKRFVTSDYVRTRLRQHPAIIAAQPVLNEEGAITGAALATLDMAALLNPLSLTQSDHLAIALVDRNGILMAWHDGSVAGNVQPSLPLGETFSRDLPLNELQAPSGEPILATGPDKTARLWKTASITNTGAHVMVGLPQAILGQTGREALRDSVAASVLSALLAALIAWVGGEFFLMRHLSTLAGSARRIGEGDLDITTSLPASAGELNIVATALTEMTDQLRARDRELSQTNSLLKSTLDTMDQGLIMYDAEDRIQVWNRRFLDLLDIPEDAVSKAGTMANLIRYQALRGEFVTVSEDLRRWIDNDARDLRVSYERERPNGTVLEVRTVPFPDGGGVRTFTDITERKVAERHVERMARHDLLTDLPNRLYLHERLRQYLAQLDRSGQPIALLNLDLDRFKILNDSLGHASGDELLRQAADRIRANVRAQDVVARLGGDEFAIIQIGQERQPQAADGLALRLIEVLGEPFDINGQRVNIGVSIGIALAPQDAMDAEELFKRADLAVSKSKNDGRNVHRFFEPGMDAAANARRALEADLRAAIAADHLEVHYQPFVAIEREEITGFEALVRWRHPERGLILPSTFIPLAEESRLIGALGDLVLRKACREAASWPEPLRVAVNVSAMQLNGMDFIAKVVAALDESGLAPNRLEIEITETALMREDEALVSLLDALRSLGVRIAMDDFGTGYSSLGYVRRFTFDKIKIDRSFIQDIGTEDAAAIIRAVVNMGERLGISVNAEGVETREQLDLVRQEGCAEVQGYYFSPPVPAREIPELLARPRRVAA